jgi:hypothetical protein
MGPVPEGPAGRGWNRAAVTLANKNARVAWALLGTEQVYRTVAA